MDTVDPEQQKRLQAMFNTVYLGLKGQNWQRSVKPGTDNFCMYRGPDGLKCAVGHLLTGLTEEQYQTVEGSCIEHVVRILNISWTDAERQLAYDLQHIHDSYSSELSGTMEAMFYEYADSHCLTVPE